MDRVSKKKWGRGATSIGALFGTVFLIGVMIASLTVYSAFVSYRGGVIEKMAKDEARQVSELVFEHLFSVMRKGWRREEIDDVIHHIQLRLKHHEVMIVRAPAVVSQYGDRLGHDQIRNTDPAIIRTLETGKPQVSSDGTFMRYTYPVLMASECQHCHEATPGDVNGVIAVKFPYAVLKEPIEDIVYPMMKVALLLILAILLATYLILRSRVVQPMQDLTTHVSEISKANDYSRDLMTGMRWPKELQTLAESFNALMGQVRSSTDALLDSSLRDPLTGLFNRRHFDAVLEQAIKDAEQGSSPFAVLLIDLDRFKPINDLFGHAAGDAVLMNVARSLQGALRESDLAARIGGDEFVVLALSTTHEEATQIAARLREVICQPELRFGHEVIHPSCSIGVGIYPKNGRLGVDLMCAADAAMYADKAARKGSR